MWAYNPLAGRLRPTDSSYPEQIGTGRPPKSISHAGVRQAGPYPYVGSPNTSSYFAPYVTDGV